MLSIMMIRMIKMMVIHTYKEISRLKIIVKEENDPMRMRKYRYCGGEG